MITKTTLFRFLRIAAMLLALPVAIEAQFNYTTDNNQVTITGYTGAGGAIVIPTTINSLPVTTIGAFAFNGIRGITSVTIPGSVTSIGSNAFQLSSMTSIVISDSVTNIESEAFEGTPLTTVTIPGSVTSLSESLFGGCAFLASVTIPNSVTNIGDDAFGSDNNLNNVIIPDSVLSIGNNAFFNCGGLSTIKIPASVTNIGIGPFEGCGTMKTILVNPNNPSYSSVGGVLFNKNQSLLVQYPSGISGSYVIPGTVSIIGAQAFASCSGLNGVTIPNSVTEIGSSAFLQCQNLTGVTIPNSVTLMDSQAFDGSGLTSIVIPSSITALADSVFDDCVSLTSVTIPDSVTRIEAYAFQSCFNLTSIIIPDSVIIIGEDAFAGSGLLSITIPENVVAIGNGAFGETQLSSAVVPDNVVNLGSFTFEYCPNLTHASIGKGVTSMGDAPFSGCPGLPAIAVDASNPSYTDLGGVVFTKGTKTLVEYPGKISGSYDIPAGVTTIADYAFSGCRLSGVTIPYGVTGIGYSAFSGTSLNSSVIFPATVTSIGDGAFSSCANLTGFYFYGNPPMLGGMYPFYFDGSGATVYYLPSAVGWGSTYGSLPTALWKSPVPPSTVSELGIQNGGFGFSVAGPNSQNAVVEACTNLVDADWQPIFTNSVGGPYFNFTDPKWGSYRDRFFRTVLTAPVALPLKFTTNNGAITITGYTGTGDPLTIPSIINGIPVTSIGQGAFQYAQLTSVTISEGVTNIGNYAFNYCNRMTAATIPASVITLSDYAFNGCVSLTGIYFQGNAPALGGPNVFGSIDPTTATVYYLAGTTGWDTTYGGLPTATGP
ncbi:MAG TPA: leucine-rich repeat domain-containing protein [Verrucomicrobiae bacterium]|jgi:hypothetical protein